MLSNVIKGFGWLTIVSGVLLGIIEGNAYEPVRYSDSDFGWVIFITYALAGAISGVLFLAISKALDYLEEIVYNTSVSKNQTAVNVSGHQSSYPSTGKTNSRPSLESLSRSHTFKSND